MTRFGRLVTTGAIAVVVLDVTAAIASRMLDFPYTWAAWGSYLVYGTTGYFVGRQFSVARAAIAGVVLGLVDATLGWAAASALKANYTPIPELTPIMWLLIAINVVIGSAIIATIGGAAGRIIQRNLTPAA